VVLLRGEVPRGVRGIIDFDVDVEPAFSQGASLVLGIGVNSADHDQACLNYAPFYDVAAYQPEFYTATLPPSAAGVVTGTLPAAGLVRFARSPVAGEQWGTGSCGVSTPVPTPTGFQARYQGHGRVALSWSDPGGLYEYEVRHADWGDVGAGWSRPRAVWDSRCPGSGSANCDTDASALVPGHTYVYQVAAWNWSGGGDGGFDYPRAFVTVPARLTVSGPVSGSGQCLTVTGTGERAGVRLARCGPKSAAQRWRYTTVSTGPGTPAYAVTSMSTGKCLVPAASAAGSRVGLGSCPATAAASEWQFRSAGGSGDTGSVGLYNSRTRLCLSTSGGTLIQARCGTTAAGWRSELAY
jgi:hypothetical protein